MMPVKIDDVLLCLVQWKILYFRIMFTIDPGICFLPSVIHTMQKIYKPTHMATTVAQCPPYGLASGTSIEV